MLVAIILSVPLALTLPLELSFENGLIKNAQIVILLFGAVLILIFRAEAVQFKWFQRLCCVGACADNFARIELGTSIFSAKNEDDRTKFRQHSGLRISRAGLHFPCRVHCGDDFCIDTPCTREKNFSEPGQPLALFAVIILAIIFSYIGEHGYFIGKECGQILEELDELILYMTLPALNFYYLRQQKNPSS